ncbi:MULTISPECIES: thiamine diphosphokinase [unclassified Ruminococcus]|uniref:thiamine diphosphokinase n=1 Tax=unclassified Ruminococcus TaxID=2608920 RepID=UPI00210DE563|nr:MULTISPECIES: thiamine diphosphokinase [unclassified Ruminococcus]MCQ4022585.1 thiamine diphosphokinase [Ruminococcus sp. zg-924]MCQ4114825.1 thiamine diphosphokinase [Ruminococcus sp. zg-921]
MGNEMKRCVIISAAPFADICFFKNQITQDDFVICADGGYVYAEKAGVTPDLIVGDFDSSTVPSSDVETVILPVHKDDTDTMYAVREGIKRNINNFVFLAATGGREDHTIANCSILLYLKHHGCNGEILSEKTRIFLLENEEIHIKNQKDKTFSIFPFACKSCGVTLSGFYYPLDCYTLKAEFPLGVSNVITTDDAVVSVSGGTAIICITDL